MAAVGFVTLRTTLGLGRNDVRNIDVEGKQVNLSLGMAVTVEIKTGQGRVMEYLLSPLLKSVKESMSE